jgi:hypothetical protein
VYFHDVLFLGTECIFFFVSCYSTSVLLKIVFRKTVVDLNSCDMMNSVPDSSLTYNTRSVGRPAVVLKGFLSNLQMNNLGKMMKCLPGGLVKP